MSQEQAMNGRRIFLAVVVPVLATGCEGGLVEQGPTPQEEYDAKQEAIAECVADIEVAELVECAPLPSAIGDRLQPLVYMPDSTGLHGGLEVTLKLCAEIDGIQSNLCAPISDTHGQDGESCVDTCMRIVLDEAVKLATARAQEWDPCDSHCPSDGTIERARMGYAYEAVRAHVEYAAEQLAETGRIVPTVDYEALMPGWDGLCEAHNEAVAESEAEWEAERDACHDELG